MSTTRIPSRALLAAWLCALIAGSGAAQAQPYAGGGLGLARQNLTCAAGAPCTENALGGKALLGYRFDPAWSAELVLLGSLSSFTASDGNGTLTWHGRVSTRALGATAGFEFGSAEWRFQARVGLAQVRGEFASETAGVPDSSASTTQPLLGLGLRRALGPDTTLRLDWDTTRCKAWQRQGSFNLVGVAVERSF
jgi:hypothetical protein